MAPQQEKARLDPTEQSMLLALVRLGNRHREKCFTYPMIISEIENYAGAPGPTVKELQKSKKRLIEFGLIVDKQVGFAPTEDGIAYFPSERQHARAH